MSLAKSKLATDAALPILSRLFSPDVLGVALNSQEQAALTMAVEALRQHKALFIQLSASEASRKELREALTELLEHEGDRVFSPIGTEHDSEELERAKTKARAALANDAEQKGGA